MTMPLSDKQLLLVYRTGRDPGAHSRPGTLLEALRLVEAVVQDVQIKKDAAIARDVLADHISEYAAEITEAVIRAQLAVPVTPGGTK